MRKIDRLLEEGLAFVQKQDEKLQPVIEYLTQCCSEQMDELPADKKFEYLLKLTNLKVESILLLTKLHEILEFDKYCVKRKS